MIAMLEPGAEAEKFLRSPDCCGGSVIVAPNSRIIAGPMGAEEGILYADCNLELAIQMKLRHDFAGHYNRPDIFHLQINRAAPTLYSVHGSVQHALPDAPAARLAAAPGALLASPVADAHAGSPPPETPDDEGGNRDA
jgi:aliphatic nitrilase